MLSSYKLPFAFDVTSLKPVLERITPGEWVAHFNKGYYEGEWNSPIPKGLSMKLFLSALLLSVVTPLAGISTLGQHIKPQPSARDISRRVSLRCSPVRLWLGDTLTLNMSVPHGRDLAILGPDNKFFWLRSWEPNDEATTASWYAFEKVKLFKIVTTEAKGRVSTDDEPIFTKTGWYRIRVSYNLETDDGTPVNQCKVYYVHRGRR